MIGQNIFSEKLCNSNVAGNGLFYVEVNLDNRSDIAKNAVIVMNLSTYYFTR